MAETDGDERDSKHAFRLLGTPTGGAHALIWAVPNIVIVIVCLDLPPSGGAMGELGTADLKEGNHARKRHAAEEIGCWKCMTRSLTIWRSQS
jgi:hypothetical protein